MALVNCIECKKEYSTRSDENGDIWVSKCGICKNWICDDCSEFCCAVHSRRISRGIIMCKRTCLVKLIDLKTNEILYNCVGCFAKYGEDEQFKRVIEK